MKLRNVNELLQDAVDTQLRLKDEVQLIERKVQYSSQDLNFRDALINVTNFKTTSPHVFQKEPDLGTYISSDPQSFARWASDSVAPHQHFDDYISLLLSRGFKAPEIIEEDIDSNDEVDLVQHSGSIRLGAVGESILCRIVEDIFEPLTPGLRVAKDSWLELSDKEFMKMVYAQYLEKVYTSTHKLYRTISRIVSELRNHMEQSNDFKGGHFCVYNLRLYNHRTDEEEDFIVTNISLPIIRILIAIKFFNHEIRNKNRQYKLNQGGDLRIAA